MKHWSRFAPLLAGLALVVLTWLVYLRVFAGDALVVYCAHDSVYSSEVLARFTKETGIPVKVKFDTEATKSLGLVELLVREKRKPRCDVFWNNEILGTLRLKEQGVLEPYSGQGAVRIPSKFKDPEGYWAGFGARSRVYVINSNRVTDPEEALLQPNLSRVAIAKPLYGTTFTHYAVLWDLLGSRGLQSWHEDLRARGIKEVNGNAVTKDLVASGVCDVGFTDSDDFFLAKDSGAEVVMEPVRFEESKYCLIPNTVAIIAGTKRADDAKKLVDFLLSEKTESQLANSASRQIPLGEMSDEMAKDLPDEVKAMAAWKENAIDLTGIGPASVACLEWLKEEYD